MQLWLVLVQEIHKNVSPTNGAQKLLLLVISGSKLEEIEGLDVVQMLDILEKIQTLAFSCF